MRNLHYSLLLLQVPTPFHVLSASSSLVKLWKNIRSLVFFTTFLQGNSEQTAEDPPNSSHQDQQLSPVSDIHRFWNPSPSRLTLRDHQISPHQAEIPSPLADGRHSADVTRQRSELNSKIWLVLLYRAIETYKLSPLAEDRLKGSHRKSNQEENNWNVNKNVNT